MIQPNELRIGNHLNVQVDNGLSIAGLSGGVVTEIGSNYISYNGFIVPKLSMVRPIPLTEEWLERFGALKYGVEENDPYFLLEYKYNNAHHDFLHFGNNGECWKYPHIKYVHQLQNLYFALTGEELTLKEDNAR